ncbi:THO complex subunit 4A [Cyberlindnera fabianii]|uniref:THO complex subunit 4A n=1 Tax=Cyberlindnera fabianii TaxID=36022 RepID=A0A1V2LDI4_CYBFA|nr:THO complex subunit 4A [Cyberlindnera fabianii]
MSSLLEKSLDEIIGNDKPQVRYRSRRSRSRSGERGGSRPGDYRDRDSDRRPKRRGLEIEEGPLNSRSRAQRLMQGRYYIKITNLKYDITESELELLLDRIGKLTFCYIEFDRSGRSTGTAYAQYYKVDDNTAAVESYNNRKAGGQIITVELIKPLRIVALPSTEREERRGGRRERPRAKTAQDLDNELDAYMRGDEPATDRESRGSRDGGRRGGRPPREKKKTTEDLDRELEEYMDNKPFASAE